VGISLRGLVHAGTNPRRLKPALPEPGETVAQLSDNVDQLADHLFRQEFGRMVSRLARILGAPPTRKRIEFCRPR
jgi:hypothetical protein